MDDNARNDKNSGTQVDINNGNIANRDIVINSQTETIWQWSAKELRRELKHCKQGYWELKKKRAVPFLWALFGTILVTCQFIFLILPNIFNVDSTQISLIATSFVLGVFIPLSWLQWLRHEDDELLFFYQDQMKSVKMVCRAKGITP